MDSGPAAPWAQWVSLLIGVGDAGVPVDDPILRERHFVRFGFLHDFALRVSLLVGGVGVPRGEIHVFATFEDVAFEQPGDAGRSAVEGCARHIGVAVGALVGENATDLRWNVGVRQQRRVVARTTEEARVPEGVDAGEQKRSHESKYAQVVQRGAISCHCIQRGIDDGERTAFSDVLDVGDAEDGLEFAGGNDHGAGAGSLAGRGLREGRGARGVEGDVALDLLHHLVDVAVEHGDGAEALEVAERLCAVLGAPAPLGIDHPERNVGEDDDGRGGGEGGDILLQPRELVGAEDAHGVDLAGVVEPDEVDALVVEAVPAGAHGAFAEALEVERAVVGGGVVLAGDVVGCPTCASP